MVAPSQATTAAPTGELDLMVPALVPKLSTLGSHTAKQVVDVPLWRLLCGLGTVGLLTPAKQADLSYGETCAGFCSSILTGDPQRPHHERRVEASDSERLPRPTGVPAGSEDPLGHLRARVLGR